MARIFLLKGDIANPGYVDIPEEATTIREAIYGIGGGIPNGKKFKAVQIGGPSGGLLVEEHLDLPLHFQKLKPYGVRRGDSVITVLDEDRCMVDVACRFMQYTQTEFCGKCVPCREGTKRMLEILDRIIDNKGTLEDLDLLEELADTISKTALCGLGQSACKPVQSTLKYFRDEYLAHVVDHHCPICNKEKPHPTIDPEKCKGCGKCRKNCPMEAITGAAKQVHVIDPEKCINCGACVTICPFGAITASKEG